MVKVAPIYLLINGEVNGPHEAVDLIERIDDGDLSENILSSIEGMPAWRSLSETFIWAYAKLLPGLPEFQTWFKLCIDGELNLKNGNFLILQTLHKTVGWDLDDRNPPEYIWKILEANTLLYRKHCDYVTRDQGWDLSVLVEYPCSELRPLKAQHHHRDWGADWLVAGGQLYGGKMIAQKDDPIWSKISDFGYPFPPFSFDLGMWMREMTIKDAEQMGFVLGDPVCLPDIQPFKVIGF